MLMDAKPDEKKSDKDGILDRIQNLVTGHGKEEDLRETEVIPRDVKPDEKKSDKD